MSNKILVKNAIYYFVLQILTSLSVLITAPYVSVILGATNLGKVGFAMAQVGWFLVIARFGIEVYGVREVAKCRDNYL